MQAALKMNISIPQYLSFSPNSAGDPKQAASMHAALKAAASANVKIMVVCTQAVAELETLLALAAEPQ